jgi:hypothetical protein
MQHVSDSWARKLGLGVALYRLFYTPKRFLERCVKQGVIELVQLHWAQHQMEQAASHLPPVVCDPAQPALEIYFLTGQQFWYQTCFCMHSLIQQTSLNLRPVLYDDGTLRSHHIQHIHHIFPNAIIFTVDEIQARLDKYLPVSQFPTLRSRRIYYPNLRKLTDIHAGSHGWKLVLDSDMLFFRPPTLLLEWLQSPHQPCHMVDVDTAYGYSPALMRQLAGVPIGDRINAGICGLNSDELDWDELEFWCETLIEKEGTHYYQEQALIAMLMTRQPCTVVPAHTYIVKPNQSEVLHPTAVLHHYVSDSKPWYFRHGWRHITPAV